MLPPMAPASRPIVFLSDFGLSNEWVGICHAVMSRIAPQSRIVDISHLVPQLNVLSGALLLADSLPYIAEDAVVLAVVDPSVGKDREIAVQAKDGRLLVGPDNGLMAPALARAGIDKVVEITSADVIVQPVSPSFRARDVLCPATAHLAAGEAIEALGPEVDPSTLIELKVPELEVEPGKIRCEVVDFNRFGNLTLNVREPDLAAAGLDESPDFAVEALSASAHARRGSTYADFEPGEYGVIIDPRGWLMVVRGNPESALEGLALAVGDQVWLSGSPS
jgi:S-adenosyl-L-methionine hydrolase (adenosine-forming)